MPPQYEAIRDKLISEGKSIKAAKTSAAKIYIAAGKGAGGRSGRAKSLHADIPNPPKRK